MTVGVLLPGAITRVTVMVSNPPVSCQRTSFPPPIESLAVGAGAGVNTVLNSILYTASSFRLVPLPI